MRSREAWEVVRGVIKMWSIFLVLKVKVDHALVEYRDTINSGINWCKETIQQIWCASCMRRMTKLTHGYIWAAKGRISRTNRIRKRAFACFANKTAIDQRGNEIEVSLEAPILIVTQMMIPCPLYPTLLESGAPLWTTGSTLSEFPLSNRQW